MIIKQGGLLSVSFKKRILFKQKKLQKKMWSSSYKIFLSLLKFMYIPCKLNPAFSNGHGYHFVGVFRFRFLE